LKSSTYLKPPDSENELLARSRELAGITIRDIAARLNLQVPTDQRKHKGWVGQLAELYLGATASNLSEPDFLEIGVELKTIPMNSPGIPKESTYVCTINLTETIGIKWESSTVRKKLSRVLWLPVESDKSIPLMHRRFGSALLWSPTARQEKILKTDWEEIMELICLGNLDQVSASMGTYLQIRPKAANAMSLGRSVSSEGLSVSTLPRGFYLRTSFTRTLFE
jgi:DNA mismatch repair protein MutH